MKMGIVYTLLTCFLWGVSFPAALFVPEYSGIYLGLARAVLIGLLSVGSVFASFKAFKALKHRDWHWAIFLALVGQIIQPVCFFLSVMYAGVAVASICYGGCPVLVAIIANLRDRRNGKPYVRMTSLIVPLTLIVLGFVFSNYTEFAELAHAERSQTDFFLGLVFGLSSTALFTAYTICNADWMLAHKKADPTMWFSAQCLVALPIALTIYPLCASLDPGMPGLLGAAPLRFVFVMLVVSVLCSFVPGILYNMAAARIPTSLLGQLLVMETVFGIIAGQVVMLEVPSLPLTAGIVMFLFGVTYALNVFAHMEKGVKAPASDKK